MTVLTGAGFIVLKCIQKLRSSTTSTISSTNNIRNFQNFPATIGKAPWPIVLWFGGGTISAVIDAEGSRSDWELKVCLQCGCVHTVIFCRLKLSYGTLTLVSNIASWFCIETQSKRLRSRTIRNISSLLVASTMAGQWNAFTALYGDALTVWLKLMIILSCWNILTPGSRVLLLYFTLSATLPHGSILHILSNGLHGFSWFDRRNARS